MAIIKVITQTDIDAGTYNAVNAWNALYGKPQVQAGDMIWFEGTGLSDATRVSEDSRFTYNAETAAASGNNITDVDFVMSSAIPSDVLQECVIRIEHTTDQFDYYKVSSWTGSTFTLDATAHPSGLVRTYTGSEGVTISKCRIGFTVWLDAGAVDFVNNNIPTFGFYNGIGAGNAQECWQYISEYERPVTVMNTRGQARISGSATNGKSLEILGIEHIEINGEDDLYRGLRDPFYNSNFLTQSFGIWIDGGNGYITHGISTNCSKNPVGNPSSRVIGCEITGGFSCVRIHTGGSVDDEVLYQEIRVERCYGRDGGSEFIYAGYTGSLVANNPRFDKVIIRDNVVARRGTEVMQVQSFLNNAVASVIENNVILMGDAEAINVFQASQDNVYQLVFGDGNVTIQNNITNGGRQQYIVFGTTNGTNQGVVLFRNNLMYNVTDGHYIHNSTVGLNGIALKWEQEYWKQRRDTLGRRPVDGTYTQRTELFGSNLGNMSLHYKGIIKDSSMAVNMFTAPTTGIEIIDAVTAAIDAAPAFTNLGLEYGETDGTSGTLDFYSTWSPRFFIEREFTSVADNGSGDCRFTCTFGHNLDTGDSAIINLSTNYNGYYNGTVVRISSTVFDITGLTFVGTDTGWVGAPSVVPVGEVCSLIPSDTSSWWVGESRTVGPGIYFVKAKTTYTNQSMTYNPKNDATNWDILRWDVNGVRSDKPGYTGTPDPATGGWCPPDNVMLPANDIWNRRGMGLSQNPHPTTWTYYRWYYADDNIGTNKVQIKGAHGADFDINDERYEWVKRKTDKFLIGSVTPVDQNGISGAESFPVAGISIASVWMDEILAAGVDYGWTAIPNSSEAVPLTSDVALTTDAVYGGPIRGMKCVGPSQPATVSDLPREYEDYSSFPSAVSDVWYMDATIFGGTGTIEAPIWVNRADDSPYMRVHNGRRMRFGVNINPAKDEPVDMIFAFRYMPTIDNEAIGHGLAVRSTYMEYNHVGGVVNGDNPASYPNWYQDQVYRMRIDVSSNWVMYKNGVQVGSGTGATIDSAFESIGSNGHPATFHYRYCVYKLGEFTASELETIYTASQAIAPWTYPKWPHLKDYWTMGSQQWDSVNKVWDINRNKTIIFGGGSGVAGTHTYQWYYWDNTDAVNFPVGNRLDEHLKIPGTDAQGSTLDRDHYIAGNGRGNPTIFNNPGGGDVWVACLITPYDSNGLAGEPILTNWAFDNIA